MSRKTKRRQYDKIDGTKFYYKCSCETKCLDCVTPEMWDASARVIHRKQVKNKKREK